MGEVEERERKGEVNARGREGRGKWKRKGRGKSPHNTHTCRPHPLPSSFPLPSTLPAHLRSLYICLSYFSLLFCCSKTITYPTCNGRGMESLHTHTHTTEFKAQNLLKGTSDVYTKQNNRQQVSLLNTGKDDSLFFPHKTMRRVLLVCISGVNEAACDGTVTRSTLLRP